MYCLCFMGLKWFKSIYGYTNYVQREQVLCVSPSSPAKDLKCKRGAILHIWKLMKNL